MPEQIRPPSIRDIQEKFSAIEMLLKATEPVGYHDYYNPRSPLLGKELSIGVIDKTDMLANDMMSWAILEYFYHGQFDLAFDLMTWYQNDWKASMSVDGMLLTSLTSQEVKYTQKQELHEFQHPAQKKGLFGGGKPNPPPPPIK